MRFENIRNTRLDKWAGKLTSLIPGIKGLKPFAEMFYWRLKKWEEKEFSNHHYEYFFTTYFGLEKEFYSNKKILDIGCGPRGSLEWANNTIEKYGLDPLAHKYQKMNGEKHKMIYVTGVSEAMPFENACFDLVSSFNSLDHVDNLDKSIEEITRVLKPGALFLLIADIHEKATITEPSAFSWNIMEKFSNDFELLSETHFEGHQLYKSIRKGVPFNHGDPTKRYGILTACLKKKAP